jgi:Sulfate permease family
VAVIEDNGSARLERLARHLPVLDWGRDYRVSTLLDDLLAAAIVTVMLVPQSLAYAMLAGLPPQLGLYASILPLLAYALFGTSRTLAVGPVAVISLMTGAAVGQLALPGPAEYAAAAAVLALLSGAILLLRLAAVFDGPDVSARRGRRGQLVDRNSVFPRLAARALRDQLRWPIGSPSGSAVNLLTARASGRTGPPCDSP